MSLSAALVSGSISTSSASTRPGACFRTRGLAQGVRQIGPMMQSVGGHAGHLEITKGQRLTFAHERLKTFRWTV